MEGMLTFIYALPTLVPVVTVVTVNVSGDALYLMITLVVRLKTNAGSNPVNIGVI